VEAALSRVSYSRPRSSNLWLQKSEIDHHIGQLSVTCRPSGMSLRMTCRKPIFTKWTTLSVQTSSLLCIGSARKVAYCSSERQRARLRIIAKCYVTGSAHPFGSSSQLRCRSWLRCLRCPPPNEGIIGMKGILAGGKTPKPLSFCARSALTLRRDTQTFAR
jgi:hypothetical protein